MQSFNNFLNNLRQEPTTFKRALYLGVFIALCIVVGSIIIFRVYTIKQKPITTIPRSDIVTFIKEKYGTTISLASFGNFDFVICPEVEELTKYTKIGQNIDCVARKDGYVMVVGSTMVSSMTQDAKDFLSNYLVKNYHLSVGRDYTITCTLEKAFKRPNQSLEQCEIYAVLNNDIAKQKSLLVMNFSAYFFNTDRETKNFIIISPWLDPFVFESIIINQDIKKVSSTKYKMQSGILFEKVYATEGPTGGETSSGGGKGSGETTGTGNLGVTLGVHAASLGVANLSGVNIVGSPGTVANAVAAGMSITGPGVACCNSAGDSVSDSDSPGVDAGNGSITYAQDGTPIYVTTTPTSTSTITCPSGYEVDSYMQYACYTAPRAAGCVSQGDSDQCWNATAGSVTPYQTSIPNCAYYGAIQVSRQVIYCAADTPSSDVGLSVGSAIPPAPAVTFKVNNTKETAATTTYGGSASLTWSSLGARDCVASGDWSGTKGTSSGSLSVTNTNIASGVTAKTYKLSCTTGKRTITKTIRINEDAQPAPTVSFYATYDQGSALVGSTLHQGQSLHLTWSTTNASTCTASNAWSGPKATSGTLEVLSSNATVSNYDVTYTLTCANLSGRTTAQSVTVTISTAVPVCPDNGTWPNCWASGGN